MCSSLHRKIDVLYLILHRTREGTSFKRKTYIAELRRRIRELALVLRQGIRDRCVQMRQQVEHPIGTLCQMAQFSCKPLCFPDGKTTVVRVPCGVKQVKDLRDIVWWYTNHHAICINYESEHPLS